VDELVDRLASAIVSDPAAPACREVVYADSVPPETLVEEAATGSLLASRRLLIVRGVSDLATKTVDRWRGAVETARGVPGGWPCEGTMVLFLAGGADRRAPILPEAEQVEVRPPAGRAVLGWVRERARALALELHPSVAQSLVDLVGEDLGRLAGELEKAALHAGHERRVSEETVRALAGETRACQYWELTQALEEGNRLEALRVLDHLLRAGEEPLVILGWVSGHLRDLWRVLAGISESSDPREIGRRLRRARPEFAVQRLIVRATAVGLARLGGELRQCFEVERALKTSSASPRALLTALVAELAR
jgi:DNA polymerase III delta subunit